MRPVAIYKVSQGPLPGRDTDHKEMRHKKRLRVTVTCRRSLREIGANRKTAIGASSAQVGRHVVQSERNEMISYEDDIWTLTKCEQ